MAEKRMTAAEAKAKGVCEKCQSKPLATMHYCEDCMRQIRERKRENLAKRNAAG
jgi:predicted amidophosphoribosyltransferase